MRHHDHGIDAGRPAADFDADRACVQVSQGCGDRIAHLRGSDSPLHLRRHFPQVEAGRQRPGGTWRQARRPGGDSGLERLPAHGTLLWRFRLRGGAAYDQPAPFPRADRIHRQSCRGSVPLLRFDFRSPDRETGAADEDGEGLRADDRPQPHARLQHSRTALLRGTCRPPKQRLRMAGIRRKHRVFAVLHLGDDRQSEGRSLLAPLIGAAFVLRLLG